MKIDPPVNFDDWRALSPEVTWSWYVVAKNDRDAWELENYHLRGELKEILEMVSTYAIYPGGICQKIRHKIEGIPGLEGK